MNDPDHLQIQYKEMGMEVYWIWIHSGASERGISYAWILA